MATVTHFETDYRKNPKYKVPLCRPYGSSAFHADKTTDKAKVSCTRCAAKLGIQPAAKVDTGSPVGTCQCCFNGQRVPNGLALHGYTRPGHGYIIGKCHGSKHEPYEVSCDQTKVFKGWVEQALAGKEDFLGRLERNEVEKLSTTVITGERIGYRTEYKTIWVMKGDPEKTNPFTNKAWDKVRSFEYLRGLAISETEQTIKAMKSHIAFLQDKIDTWKPQPWPPEKA